MALARHESIIGSMEKGDGDSLPDDGIVAEDLTQLVEHIELTGAHRLPDDNDWELATPATDLDDAPILIGTLPDEPGIAGMDVGDDTQMFIETQADLARLLPGGERRSGQAAALAAERARWQKRADELERTLAERNQLLAERERRIEELQARLATRTLEREGLAAELRESRPVKAAVTDALPAEAPATRAPDADVEPDYTQELPVPELPISERAKSMASVGPGMVRAPALQLLIYPGLDFVNDAPSMHDFADTFPLTAQTIEFFLKHYLPEGVDPSSARLSPGRTQDLSGLAPALIYAAGFDMLLDQGQAYAQRLSEAGVGVEYCCFENLPHGFVAFPALAPAAEHALRRIARETAAALKVRG